MSNNDEKIKKYISAALKGEKLPAGIPPQPLYIAEIQKNGAIAHSGFEIDRLFISLSGSYACRVYSEQGNSVSALTLSGMQVYGFVELMCGAPGYHASVYAASGNCRLLCVPANLFMELVDSDLELSRLMVRYLSDMSLTNMYTNSETRSSPKENLAQYLYSSAVGCPLPHVIKMARDELAEQLHLNPRTLYRYLSDLKGQGAVSTYRGKTQITEQNLKVLQSICGEQTQ